jgi:hypothetical protein
VLVQKQASLGHLVVVSCNQMPCLTQR